jgi:hypothetical protein
LAPPQRILLKVSEHFICESPLETHYDYEKKGHQDLRVCRNVLIHPSDLRPGFWTLREDQLALHYYLNPNYCSFIFSLKDDDLRRQKMDDLTVNTIKSNLLQ